MSIRDIDKILNELSIKFNRIFYDRDFICSVLEDFRVILENKDKCCIVVIFPALGPNYLKAIQYQAELFDLATFTLGSRKLLCVGVCFKEYTTRNVQSCESLQTGNKMPEIEAECSMRVRKKRPERQLYIPPAQRSSQKNHPNIVQKQDDGNQKQKKHITEKKDSRKKKSAETDVAKFKISEIKLIPNKEDSFHQQDYHYFFYDFVEYFLWYYTFSVQWKYRVPGNKSSFLRDNSVMQAYIFSKISTKMFDKSLYRIPLYFCCPIARLDVLRRDIFLWQPNCYYYVNRKCKISNCELVCDDMDRIVNEPISDIPAEILIPVTVDNCGREIKDELGYDLYDLICLEEEYSAQSNRDGLSVNHCFFVEDNTLNDIEKILHNILGPENPQKSENVKSTTLKAASEVFTISNDDSGVNFVFSRSIDALQSEEKSLDEVRNPKTVVIQKTPEALITTNMNDVTTNASESAISFRSSTFCPEDVIETTLELDDGSQNSEVLDKSEITDSVKGPAIPSRSDVALGGNTSVIDGPLQSDHTKCEVIPAAPKVLVISDIKSDVNCTKIPIHPRLDEAPKEKDIRKRTEHDEEKEIMKRTKENINRRIKPIMKYVEDADNTLCISEDDNLNNWEDLFSDDGQLHEDLVEEIVKKVGKEVTIVKAKENYMDYCSVKQIEEFEHMVELYDFPSTFETNDLIQAFSEIQSDAMYVKWVDDTHAILVLGSLAQAQKAVSLTSPIIKARPMTAASRAAFNCAQRHDLKPAMKRPQTNLQTARRLITTHLGKKSGISQEKSAQERNDLRTAREQKRLVKKNEQDAWEGNLRSSLN